MRLSYCWRCLTCKVPEATLTKADGGVCYCGTGYVREFSPTVACGVCAPNDCVCSGLKGTPCLKPEHQEFVTFVSAGYNLPLASPTNGAWCFGSSIPASAREISEVEAVIGPITRDGSGNLQPTQEECFELLRAQWSFISDWFQLLFPNYSPPASATAEEKYATEMGLRIWILRFGGSNMFTQPAWRLLVAAFNAPSAQWSNYLSWASGYSTDGEIIMPYPAALQSALKERDIALISRFSTVCGAADCNLKLQ